MGPHLVVPSTYYNSSGHGPKVPSLFLLERKNLLKTGFAWCPIFVTVWLDQAALRWVTIVPDCWHSAVTVLAECQHSAAKVKKIPEWFMVLTVRYKYS